MDDPHAPVTKSLKHKTMAAAAAEELRRRILSGQIAAGAQLRQSALAEEFGISRIPLREAFLQLEAEGLVRINAHRGATVVELTSEEIDELFDLRAVIEPMLLLRSAPRLTPEDLAALDTLLADYHAELSTARHVERWGKLNTEFHCQLYRHADRPRSLALALNLLQESDRHTRVHLSLSGTRERADAEHREILRLCRKGKIEQAAETLRKHIESVAKALRRLRNGQAAPR